MAACEFQKVSVVIPAYNVAAFVGSAISSVLNQTYKPAEIIVVDDGSTDATSDVVASFGESVFCLSQPNRGLSAARNRGIREAKGDIICFLDADDEWLPEKLEKQLAVFAKTPAVGMVHSGYFNWDGADNSWSIGQPWRIRFQGKCYTEFFPRNGVCVSTVAVRRECLEAVGLFDEAIRRPTTQDYDLWWRISRGHDLGYVEEPLVRYRIHSANASKNLLAMAEDDLYVIAKAVRTDPALWQIFGRKTVSRRLASAHLLCGYLLHDQGRLNEAQVYFRQVVQYTPTDPLAWIRWLAGMLPADAQTRLRTLKRILAAGLRRAPLRQTMEISDR